MAPASPVAMLIVGLEKQQPTTEPEETYSPRIVWIPSDGGRPWPPHIA